MKHLAPIFFICSLLFFISCEKKLNLESFELYDQSQSFGENNFAVVTEKYITSLDIPSEEGIKVAQLRMGEVFEVQETSIITNKNTQNLWVKINDGWVLSTAVQLYSSVEKAKTASKQLFN